MKKITALVAGLALSVSVGLVPSIADAATKPAPKPTKFANCTLLNKKFPHGVARQGARDKVSGRSRPVTTFTINPTWYQVNTHLDRDKDGVACEKR